MTLISEIQNYAKSIPADIKESKGMYTLSFLVAERKAFLSTQKLQYVAKFRILEDEKVIRFSEMLKESGTGVSTGGDFDSSPGFGFKAGTYKTSGTSREGSIEEQSTLLGKKYQYRFDFKSIRSKFEELAAASGYRFEVHLTTKGL